MVEQTMFSDFPDVVDVEQMCRMLGNIGKKQGYKLVREKFIPAIRIGRTYRIAKKHIIEFVIKAG